MADLRGEDDLRDKLLLSEEVQRETEMETGPTSPEEVEGAVQQHQDNEAQHSTIGNPPPSRSVIRGIFLLLGIGVLAPWNAFISAKDYFDKRICNETNHLESKFSLVYNLASVTSLGLLIAIQTLRDRRRSEHHRVGEQDGILTPSSSNLEKDHSFFMVILPLSLYLVAFLGQAMMVRIINMPFFLFLTFLGLALCGMACSVAQAGIVATAGLFHSNLAMNPYLEVGSLIPQQLSNS